MLCKQKPYFAFYLGAGDNRKADQAATQGLVLAVIHGVVMTVCCIAMMPAFLGMFTSSETVIELGVRYSVVAFAFTLIIIVGVTFEKILSVRAVLLSNVLAAAAFVLLAALASVNASRLNRPGFAGKCICAVFRTDGSGRGYEPAFTAIRKSPDARRRYPETLPHPQRQYSRGAIH